VWVCCRQLSLLLQDQERELLQRGYETLQVLEAERIADLLKAGAHGWLTSRPVF
jgi:hypothetical protein